MRAYKETITKAEFVKELKAHQKADNFVKGQYWQAGKGCAVGCSLESISRVKNLKFSFEDHELYETHLGIPEWLARLEDTIFEQLPNERAKSWPVEFAQAIRVGADLEKAKVPFIVMVLEHTLVSMNNVKFDKKMFPDVASAIKGSRTAVEQMIKAQKSGNEAEIRAAAYSAYSAAYSAYSAAYSAYSARSAAYSAAYSADSAAYSAADSADSAAYSARSAAYSAYSAARSAAFEYYANRLLEILKETK